MGKIFRVCPSGSDKGDGSKQIPFATLAGARDAIRQLKRERRGLPKGGAMVKIDVGEYYCDRTITFGLAYRDNSSVQFGYL